MSDIENSIPDIIAIDGLFGTENVGMLSIPKGLPIYIAINTSENVKHEKIVSINETLKTMINTWTDEDSEQHPLLISLFTFSNIVSTRFISTPVNKIVLPEIETTDHKEMALNVMLAQLLLKIDADKQDNRLAPVLLLFTDTPAENDTYYQALMSHFSKIGFCSIGVFGFTNETESNILPGINVTYKQIDTLDSSDFIRALQWRPSTHIAAIRSPYINPDNTNSTYRSGCEAFLKYDYNTAIEAFTKRSDVDKDAMFILGYHYYWGRGVVKNKRTAAKLFKKAADAGHVDAKKYEDWANNFIKKKM